MPIVYDKLLKLMSEKGITSYTIKKNKIIGQATLKKIKDGGDIDTRTISKLCKLLNCQPGDILEYVEDEEESLHTRSGWPAPLILIQNISPVKLGEYSFIAIPLFKATFFTKNFSISDSNILRFLLLVCSLLQSLLTYYAP